MDTVEVARGNGVPVRHRPELYAMAKFIAEQTETTIGDVFDSRAEKAIRRTYARLKAREEAAMHRDHGGES